MDLEYNTDTFIYICIVLGAMVVSRRIRPSMHTIVGLVLGLVVVYHIKKVQSGTLQTFYNDMDSIMASGLLKTERNRDIYRDSILIQFLYTYREYHQYNPDAYNELVRHLNDIIVSDHDLGAIQRLDENAREVYQSFVHTVPQTTQSIQKFKYGEYLLGGYLDGYLKTAKYKHIGHIKTRGIDNMTYFPPQYPTPTAA